MHFCDQKINLFSIFVKNIPGGPASPGGPCGPAIDETKVYQSDTVQHRMQKGSEKKPSKSNIKF